jgi:hypothetical protein
LYNDFGGDVLQSVEDEKRVSLGLFIDFGHLREGLGIGERKCGLDKVYIYLYIERERERENEEFNTTRVTRLVVLS